MKIEEIKKRIKAHQKESGHTGRGKKFCTMCLASGYFDAMYAIKVGRV